MALGVDWESDSKQSGQVGMGSRFEDEDIDDDVGDYYDDYVDDVDDVGIVFNSPSLGIMVKDISPF